MKKSLIYVALDVHKDSIVVAMATGRQQAVVAKDETLPTARGNVRLLGPYIRPITNSGWSTCLS
jgi:hypothetical protein